MKAVVYESLFQLTEDEYSKHSMDYQVHEPHLPPKGLELVCAHSQSHHTSFHELQ